MLEGELIFLVEILSKWILAFLECCCFSDERFAQSEERNAPPRIPIVVNIASASVSSQNMLYESFVHFDQLNYANRNSVMIDEYSDEDEEFQIAKVEQKV